MPILPVFHSVIQNSIFSTKSLFIHKGCTDGEGKVGGMKTPYLGEVYDHRVMDRHFGCLQVRNPHLHTPYDYYYFHKYKKLMIQFIIRL